VEIEDRYNDALYTMRSTQLAPLSTHMSANVTSLIPLVNDPNHISTDMTPNSANDTQDEQLTPENVVMAEPAECSRTRDCCIIRASILGQKSHKLVE